ncbi:MAG: RluA family pseudouridine synthase, partial [Candidatus Kapabacteria bacterium]|nr:RluA family pseudouridine synthase [Candidatus Kapabacteria bacterium]
MEQNDQTLKSIETDKHYPPKEETVFEYVAPSGTVPLRLDVFLTNAIKNATRNKVQTVIDDGLVTVNGKVGKASYKVQPNDVVLCRVMKRPPIELLPENIPLDIVFEDADVLVVNKPAGMVVHPAHGNRYGTLVNAVLYHLGARESVMIAESDELEDGDTDEGEVFDSDEIRPGIVHRIDKDTSGILVIGKNPVATEKLSRQFAERTAKRVYHALVWGIMKDDSATIDTLIDRSPRDRKIYAVSKTTGKSAITDYTVLSRYDFLTLVQLSLRTGRTHQIRVHCSSIHHPLLGDMAYGGASVAYGGVKAQHRHLAHRCLELMPRQALHAT